MEERIGKEEKLPDGRQLRRKHPGALKPELLRLHGKQFGKPDRPQWPRLDQRNGGEDSGGGKESRGQAKYVQIRRSEIRSGIGHKERRKEGSDCRKEHGVIQQPDQQGDFQAKCKRRGKDRRDKDYECRPVLGKKQRKQYQQPQSGQDGLAADHSQQRRRAETLRQCGLAVQGKRSFG